MNRRNRSGSSKPIRSKQQQIRKNKQMGLANLIFAFGKSAATPDHRDLNLPDVLLAKDPLPEAYDVDDKHEIPIYTYQNPPKNNCVIAGRAHQTLRFELAEQKVLINITDEDVDREFKEQTAGGKTDIDVRPSLRLWRTRGWEAAGQNLKIKAFTKIDPIEPENIKRAILINIGVGLGFFLPDSAKTQFKNHQPWEVTQEKAAPNGHYVYVSGYTKDGPVCITWGRKQQMSWAFVDKYCDEAWAIIDAIDTPEKKRTLNEKKINKFLATCAPVSGEADRTSPGELTLGTHDSRLRSSAKKVQVAKQPNINMGLKDFFVGKSSSGNLEEAIQNALKKARKSHANNFKWEVDKIAENQLTFPPLSVRIRVGGGKGDGGIGPKKPR